LDGEGVIEGERVACEAVAERDEALHAEEIDVCFGDGRRVCLVELVDANRRTWDGGPDQLGRTHHCTFIAALCTLRPASVPIMPTTFDTVALAAVATISATVSKL